RVLAHAIGYHPPRFGGGGDHGAARAHAEAVDGAAIFRVIDQLVVGGAQLRVTGVLAQAGLVDQALRVLDAKAHGKGLGFHEYAPSVQHAEGIAGAMTQRHYHVAAAQGFAVLQHHTFELVIVDHKIGHLAFETHLAAQGNDLLAHGRHHASEAEGADVRFADVDDLLRRAGPNELLSHLAGVELRILDLAVELAVGEQAGPAFTELHVGFGVQDLLAPQRPGVLGAAAHVLAALQHDGLEAHLRQQQRRKQPARAKPNDQLPLAQIGWCLPHRLIIGIRRRTDIAIIGQTPQYATLVAHFQNDDVDEQDDAVLLALVVAAFEYGEVQQIGIAD